MTQSIYKELSNPYVEHTAKLSVSFVVAIGLLATKTGRLVSNRSAVSELHCPFYFCRGFIQKDTLQAQVEKATIRAVQYVTKGFVNLSASKHT